MLNFHILIPARYASTRLPGKPLLDIAGKPMIQHVYARAGEAGAASVSVATDDKRIAAAVAAVGGRVCMTSPQHRSGTDRIAAAATELGLAADAIVVNVQGDEPEMPPGLIRQVAQLLADSPTVSMATACAPLERAQQLHDPNVVKVVRNAAEHAIYFSRTAIPWAATADATGTRFLWRRHIGIYAYRVAYLQQFTQLAECPLERSEKLEQLRALWYGDAILCCEAEQVPPPGVDSQVDLAHTRARMAEA